MKRPARLLSCVLLSTTPIPLVAAAADLRHSVAIVPQIGYRVEGGNADYFFGSDVRNGEVFGLTLAYAIERRYTLELLVRQQSTSARSSRAALARLPASDLDILHLHGGGAIWFDVGSVRPFVTGSVGVGRVDFDAPGYDGGGQLSASVGGGVQIPISDNFALRLELRRWWTDLDDRRFLDDAAIHQVEASIGFALSF